MSNQRARTSPRRQAGMTLIEVLAVMGFIAIIMTLGAGALRNYWFGRALESGQAEISTGLRRLQEQAVSEGHPLVFGARFRSGSDRWGIVRYDPTTDVCVQEQVVRLGSGVTVSAAAFSGDTSSATTRCKVAIDPLESEADQYALFYGRGNATAGSVTVRNSEGRTRTVSVSAVTGRVTESQ